MNGWAIWSSGSVFVSGVGGLSFIPKWLIGYRYNDANGSPPLRHFFERHFVVQNKRAKVSSSRAADKYGSINQRSYVAHEQGRGNAFAKASA